MSLTLDQLEKVVWRATMMALGNDPDSTSQDVQKSVRLSWALSETGNPNWKREDSTTFIRISPSQDNLGTTTDVSYHPDDDGLLEKHRYYRCYDIYYVIYGDPAFSTSDLLKDSLLRQPIREYLAGYNLAWISGVSEPVRTAEQDGSGEWWNRFDLQVRLYELAERDYPVNQFIGAIPDITIMAGGNS